MEIGLQIEFMFVRSIPSKHHKLKKIHLLLLSMVE